MTSAPERAYAFLRSHLAGRFDFDGHHEPLKVVIAPDGRLVASAMVAMLHSLDTVLFLPDDCEESLQLQVTIEELDQHGPLRHCMDRWQAYHGSPPDVRWALLSIDAGKFEGQFVDGVALALPNPLADDEPRLCRELNADPAALARACGRGLPMRIEQPVVVGVDPRGFDVRGAFQVYRIEAPGEMPDADAVRSAFRALAG